MEIVYLHQYFNNLDMPGGTRSFEMARRLVQAGHKVHLVTTRRDSTPRPGEKWTQTLEAGIRVHWLTNPYSNRMGYSRRILSFFRFALLSAGKAAELNGDVIFATSTPLTIALPALYASHKNHIPMVFEVRDLWPDLPIAIGAIRNSVAIKAAFRLEKLVYRKAIRIVALSPGMQEGILEKGVPAEKVRVIPNSADLELFDVPEEIGQDFRRQTPWLADRPLVVYTGTLGKMNGLSYLVRLAEFVKRKAPEVCFFLVGDGAEFEGVQREARSRDLLERNIFMSKALPKKEMPAVLSAATLALSLFIDLPAMWANSANKFFDSLASGTPIAINYRGWQADLLKETGVGIVLDPQDHALAAEQLLGVVLNPPWLKRAGLAAKKLARERFSRDILAGELEAVLMKALEKYKREVL